MQNIEKNGFIHKFYLFFGIAGCIVTILHMLSFLLLKNGVIRAEYRMLYIITIPNALSRLLLIVWTAHYMYTKNYGRDINLFAKNLIGLSTINIVITAFDESTVLFYLVQSVTCLMYAIFISILINQRKYTTRVKKYATLGFIINVFLYITIAILAFLIVMSFSNYDPYIVTFIGLTYACLIVGMICVKAIEEKYKKEAAEI